MKLLHEKSRLILLVLSILFQICLCQRKFIPPFPTLNPDPESTTETGSTTESDFTTLNGTQEEEASSGEAGTTGSTSSPKTPSSPMCSTTKVSLVKKTFNYNWKISTFVPTLASYDNLGRILEVTTDEVSFADDAMKGKWTFQISSIKTSGRFIVYANYTFADPQDSLSKLFQISLRYSIKKHRDSPHYSKLRFGVDRTSEQMKVEANSNKHNRTRRGAGRAQGPKGAFDRDREREQRQREHDQRQQEREREQQEREQQDRAQEGQREQQERVHEIQRQRDREIQRLRDYESQRQRDRETRQREHEEREQAERDQLEQREREHFQNNLRVRFRHEKPQETPFVYFEFPLIDIKDTTVEERRSKMRKSETLRIRFTIEAYSQQVEKAASKSCPED